jgi:hypothetical protein
MFTCTSVAQPFYTRGTPTPFCILWGGEMVYGIDWPRQLLTNRPQPKNFLFYVHNCPFLLLCHSFEIYLLFEINFNYNIFTYRLGQNVLTHV